MTDQEIITLIRNGRREKPIKFLYAEKPKINGLLLKHGCTETMASEIFNDSLIILLEKVTQPDFTLTSKLTTYLGGINLMLAKNELRKQHRNPELEWNDTLMVGQDDVSYDFEREEKLKHIERLITKVSEKCQQIFKLFYFEKKSMTEIADELNYTSTNSAKTQKYKCLEQAFKLSEASTEYSLEKTVS